MKNHLTNARNIKSPSQNLKFIWIYLENFDYIKIIVKQLTPKLILYQIEKKILSNNCFVIEYDQ